MPNARLRVAAAGPLVSLQDAGRPGFMRFGVPKSGPMDRLAHAAANVAIGNAVGATAIEVSVGGLAIECISGAMTVAVAGGEFRVEHDGVRQSAWSVMTLSQGQQLRIRPDERGSWAYLAVCGALVSTRWLGHSATHSMSGFGGGFLQAGDEIEIEEARSDSERDGEIPVPVLAQPVTQAQVVMGPQSQHFVPQALDAFTAGPFAFTTAVDRMGVRLAGPALPLAGALSIPSEPIVRGSIQVAGDGVPTLLTADHQTTGGYPKIATVVSADLDRLAQMRAPEQIRFVPVTPAEAIVAARSHAAMVDDYLIAISKPQRTLAQRLRTQNLIGDSAPDALPDVT